MLRRRMVIRKQPSDRRRDGITCNETVRLRGLKRSIDDGLDDVILTSSLSRFIGPSLPPNTSRAVKTLKVMSMIDLESDMAEEHGLLWTNAPLGVITLPRIDIELKLINDMKLDRLTGWGRDDLIEWRNLVFGPEEQQTVTGRHNHRFDLDTLIVASLWRWRKGVDYKNITSEFGRDGRVWGEGIDEMTHMLYEGFAKKLMRKDAVALHADDLKMCRDAVNWRLGEPENPKWKEFFPTPGEDTTIGWIDCIMLMACRPGSTSIGGSTSDFANLLQSAFYSGYAKYHGYKYQALMLATGMCGGIYGGSVRNSDRYFARESDISAEIQRISEAILGPGGVLSVYGDKVIVRFLVLLFY